MTRQSAMVDIKGLQSVEKILKNVSPDLRREMFADLGRMMKSRVTEAQALTPYDRRRKGRPVGKPHLRTLTYLTKSGAKRDVSGGRKQGLFGFKAISAAKYANVMDLGGTKTSSVRTRALTAKYGPAPRFLGKVFLGAGSGGSKMWGESKSIVDKYVAKANEHIEGAWRREAGLG